MYQTHPCEHVKVISSCASYLLQLISEILDVAKTEASSIALNKIPLKLTELIQGVFEEVPQKHILRHGSLLAEKLRRCLVNLVTSENFTKSGYVRPGSTADIHSDRINSASLRYLLLGSQWMRRVSLFQPFRQTTSIDSDSASLNGILRLWP